MAHVVDKEENLRGFIDAMNNSSSIFTRSKNFGKSSKDVSISSTPSTALSPTITPAAMDPIVGRPGTPSPLQPISQDFEDGSPGVLSSRDMNQLPQTPQPRSNRAEPDHVDQWFALGSSFHTQQNQDDRPTYPDSLVNKLLVSPQLAGTRAPPPTPTTAPHNTTEDNEDIEDIVATQVNKHFANKTNAVGLGESIHAPHRSSPLAGGWLASKTTPDQKLSDETRRLRELSFERASFKVADSPSASGSIISSPASTANGTSKPATASYAQGADEVNTVPSSNIIDWVPPHLRLGQNAPAPVKPLPSEHESKPQVSSGNYASSLVKKMEAGTKSFLEKWGGQKEKHADHTPTTWEEVAQPKSRDEPVQTPASSVASKDEEETRIVHTPAELMTIQSPTSKGTQATSVADLIPAPLHEPLESEESSKQSPATLAGTLLREPDQSFLPPHLRIGPSSSVAAQKPKPASSGDVTKETPSVIQPHPALPATGASKVTVPPVKDQILNVSNPGISTAKPSSGGIGPISTSSPSYISGAQAVAAAAKALGRDGALFFKSYPKPEGRGRPVARIRKAVISHLPPRCTAKFVASLVYGGQIESIIIKPSLAEVLFVNAQDCTQFCTDNENGLDYGKDKNEFVLVDMNKDVDVVGGKLQEMIDTGATRCVRVIGVDHGWTKERLWDLAEKRNSKLEHLEDQMNEETKNRTVTFRFCKMDDANTFKASLVRDEDWEHCHVRFAPDPCATAKGVHFDD